MDGNTAKNESLTNTQLSPGMRLWVKINEGIFGPGIMRSLMGINETKSLTLAAEQAGMSYYKAYRLIKRLEEDSGCKMLERRVGGVSGGSSELTNTAIDLLKRYNSFAEDASVVISELFERHFADFEPQDLMSVKAIN